MYAEFLEDKRIVDQFMKAREAILARRGEVSISAIADQLGMSIVSTLWATSRHNAWGCLGLDRDTECVGPHVTYH